jgi:hypothetical protein
MRKYLLDLRLEGNCCAECGAELGAGFGLDPACDCCSPKAENAVNNIEHGDFVFDVLITDNGNLMFTVYEVGTGPDDEDNHIVDIIVDKATLKVSSF